MNNWQPMSTYPNDIGVRMLLVNGTAFPGAREHGRWFLVRPTHNLRGYTYHADCPEPEAWATFIKPDRRA